MAVAVSERAAGVGEPERSARRDPFQGLIPYRESDSEWFFGRRKDIQVLDANIRATRLTVVYGPSGVGKTSVLRAGVASDVNRRAREALARGMRASAVAAVYDGWQHHQGIKEHLLRTVRESLNAVFPTEELVIEPDKTVEHHFARWTEQTGADLIVILDQFEEFFRNVLESRQGHDLAVEIGQAISSSRSYANFLIALREDRLGELDRLKGAIPGLLDNYLRLDHLDRASATEAIERPVAKWNEQHPEEPPVELEPGLVDALLDQVGVGERQAADADAAPALSASHRYQASMLQLVATRLWAREVEELDSRCLRITTLDDDLGGAQKIAEDHLTRIMRRLEPAEADLAAKLFDRLVTPSGEKHPAKESDLLEWHDNDARVTRLLTRLSSEQHRLLKTVPSRTADPRDRYFEIFHDSLGPPIQRWVGARREATIEAIRRDTGARWLAVVGIVVAALALAVVVFWDHLLAGLLFAVLAALAGGAKLLVDARRLGLGPMWARTLPTLGLMLIAAVLAVLAAAVAFATNARVSFMGEAEPGIRVSETEVEIGEVPVGTASAPQTVRIDRRGSGTLRDLALTGSSEDFTWGHDCPPSLGEDASCTVTVEVLPETPGDKALVVEIAHGDDVLGAMVFRAVGIAPDAELSTDAVDFGNVQVGDVVHMFIELRNEGTAPFRYAIALQGDGSDAYTMSTDCREQLDEGASCRLDIEFGPDGVGERQAIVEVAGAEGETLRTDLRGAGVAPAAVAFPETLDFDILSVGRREVRSIQLRNVGIGDVTLGELGLSGAARSDYDVDPKCPDALAPGETCIVEVGLEPRLPGRRHARLEIPVSGGVPLSIALRGAGTSLIARTSEATGLRLRHPLEWVESREVAWLDDRFDREGDTGWWIADDLEAWDDDGASGLFLAPLEDPVGDVASALASQRMEGCDDPVVSGVQAPSLSGHMATFRACPDVGSEFVMVIGSITDGRQVLIYLDLRTPNEVAAKDEILDSLTLISPERPVPTIEP